MKKTGLKSIGVTEAVNLLNNDINLQKNENPEADYIYFKNRVGKFLVISRADLKTPEADYKSLFVISRNDFSKFSENIEMEIKNYKKVIDEIIDKKLKSFFIKTIEEYENPSFYREYIYNAKSERQFLIAVDENLNVISQSPSVNHNKYIKNALEFLNEGFDIKKFNNFIKDPFIRKQIDTSKISNLHFIENKTPHNKISQSEPSISCDTQKRKI